MIISTNDIKNGVVLNLDGKLWQVTEFQHVKPGKGGAFVRTKIKNVLTGKVIDKTFNAGIKVDAATINRQEMQYLYYDGEFVFMDKSTYEQLSVPENVVGELKKYMSEGLDVTVATSDGETLFIELPASVQLTVTFTEPGLQGDRSSGGTKPATLSTGADVQVPLFINEGDVLKVDTRTGEYISRI
jgi:elongation factor P